VLVARARRCGAGCSGAGAPLYCGAACVAAHWPVHREECAEAQLILAREYRDGTAGDAEVEVEVDGVPGQTFAGTVQGLSGATGSRFSLLPPDNASGNFTKVVQRVPVRVELGADALGLVRPGMSAVVTVHVK